MTVPKSVMDALNERSGGWCEVKLPGCSGRATTPHHRLLRKHGGPDTLANLLHVDANCHTASPAAIHRNPKASYAVGHLVHADSPEARELRGDLPPLLTDRPLEETRRD